MARLGARSQRRGQAPVGENHRVEAAGQLTQFGYRLLELGFGRIQLRHVPGDTRPEQAKRQ
jgi:hypothetical protein